MTEKVNVLIVHSFQIAAVEPPHTGITMTLQLRDRDSNQTSVGPVYFEPSLVRAMISSASAAVAISTRDG
jgi:hypothetical protein